MLLLAAVLASTTASPPQRSGPGCPATDLIPIAAPRPAFVDDSTKTRFSFIAYGDTRGGADGMTLQTNHGRVVESMLETIHKREKGPEAIRFVVMSGDAVSNGMAPLAWSVSFDPLIDQITGAGVAYFPTVGNHDVTSAAKVDSPLRSAGLCNFLAATVELLPREGTPHRLNGYSAYGFGYGNTFFLTFDSQIAGDSTQFHWLEKQLNALDRRRYPNVVVWMHQPVMSSGPHGGPVLEPASAQLRNFYMPLFRQHHVRMILAGHDHLFEHWVERYHDESGDHRIDQIVSAGGGAPAYTYNGEPDLRDYLRDGMGQQLTVEHIVKPSPDATKNPLHYMVIDVDGDQIRVEVIGVDRGRGFAPYQGRTWMVLK